MAKPKSRFVGRNVTIYDNDILLDAKITDLHEEPSGEWYYTLKLENGKEILWNSAAITWLTSKSQTTPKQTAVSSVVSLVDFRKKIAR